VASGILRAVGSSTAGSSFRRDYVALGPQRVGQAFYADAWYHAVLASGTMHSSTRLNVLRVRAVGADDAAPLVRRLLEDDPGLRVIVAPAYVDPLRRSLASPALARRVVSWAE
jgi:hypothetical protein